MLDKESSILQSAYFNNGLSELHIGNSVDVLKNMPDKFIQTVVTSPPYFGLRDYGTANWVGGNENCDHAIGRVERNGLTQKQISNMQAFGSDAVKNNSYCPKCNALRIDQQIGLELSIEEYINNLILLFREIHRTLKDDGTIWINIGDSYNSKKSSPSLSNLYGKNLKAQENPNAYLVRPPRINNLKSKDLMGIPWKLAFALQDDGWFLRSDIIWTKPNPMPESVKDRPTKAHEYIFLLSKQKNYFYDYKAIQEQAISEGKKMYPSAYMPETNELKIVQDFKNKSTVWNVNVRSYSEAHFATYPEKLIYPCVQAGSKVGDIVLDPFIGSGTTSVVAQKLNRKSIGIDLNGDYLKIAQKRIESTNLPLF